MCTSIISGVVWCFNGFHRIECKITPGMELLKQQYFKEQYIILTRTEEGHEKDYTNFNFCLQNSCTPQVLNDIRTPNDHNRPS